MQAYSSFPNIMNFKRSNIEISSMYKRYALLFDKIIFNRYGCPIGDGDFFSSLHEYLSTYASDEEDIKGKLKLSKNKYFRELFIDLWNLVENPEQFHKDSREYVADFHEEEISNFSWARNLIDIEMGIENHHKEYKAAAIVGADIKSDLGFNFLLKNKFKDFEINFAPVVNEAFTPQEESANLHSLFSTNLVIPKFEELSWDQIFELRQDKNIKAFRKKLFSISRNTVSIDEPLSKEIENALWDIAKHCKPNIMKSIFEAVSSNIPIPSPVNPFGLYYGGRDIIQTAKQKNSNSWVYFIQSMKSVS